MTTTEKLVEKPSRVTYKSTGTRRRSTKKHVAEPHIRPHTIKGRTYYTYCHGAGPEIYLGTADAILKAVKGGK